MTAKTCLYKVYVNRVTGDRCSGRSILLLNPRSKMNFLVYPRSTCVTGKYIKFTYYKILCFEQCNVMSQEQ